MQQISIWLWVKPGVAGCELAQRITEPDRRGVKLREGDYAIPTASFAWDAALAICRHEDVATNDILFRPARQETYQELSPHVE
ncbi:hypothetical protein QUF31_12160 [Dickeya chrysanthemi]|uniref:hypothetical protein n=1 Tax=Dickeya chrysanthemi TaxID=556 RepID=UPI0025A07DF6|nr:hypothetical protein [Dickeya chrysanthemi]WJM83931.1 hypothetical protein QUF31_12160 [Dickeya chrysanthemi]